MKNRFKGMGIWKIIVTYWPIIIGVGGMLGGTLTWLSSRRARKLKEDGGYINNIKSVIGVFEQLKEMESYFKGRIITLKEHITDVEKLNNQLDGMVKEQKTIIKKQQRIINQQSKTLESYKNKFGELNQT